MSTAYPASRPSGPHAEIFCFSPIFGIAKEGKATILDAIPGHARHHRVLFQGQKATCVRAVFPELQGRLDTQFIRVLNELISFGAGDLPTILGDFASFPSRSSRPRKINLQPKKRGR